MSQKPICRIAAKPLNIRLPRSLVPHDPRADFVRSVCDILIESRFGPGRTAQLVVKLGELADDETVFNDLLGGELTPCYAFSPELRRGYQVMEAAYRKAKQTGFVHPPKRRPVSDDPTAQARGSP